jgi:hypothetical protein
MKPLKKLEKCKKKTEKFLREPNLNKEKIEKIFKKFLKLYIFGEKNIIILNGIKKAFDFVNANYEEDKRLEKILSNYKIFKSTYENFYELFPGYSIKETFEECWNIYFLKRNSVFNNIIYFFEFFLLDFIDIKTPVFANKNFPFDILKLSFDYFFIQSFKKINSKENYYLYELESFYKNFYLLLKNGTMGFWFGEKDIIILPIPKIKLSEAGLHSEKGPAIEWENEKYYFLHGVEFSEGLWEKIINKQLSLKEILEIKNIEQRMTALKYMDPEQLLKEANAELLDKSTRGNELYLIKGIFREPAYFLKYKCPSTGRIYIKGVPPEIGQEKDSDLAQAWSLNLTKEEYLDKLKKET